MGAAEPGSADASISCRANTRCAVIVRSARDRPRKLTTQWKSALTRFVKPARNVTRTVSQSSQATNPETRTRPSSPIA